MKYLIAGTLLFSFTTSFASQLPQCPDVQTLHAAQFTAAPGVHRRFEATGSIRIKNNTWFLKTDMIKTVSSFEAVRLANTALQGDKVTFTNGPDCDGITMCHCSYVIIIQDGPIGIDQAHELQATTVVL